MIDFNKYAKIKDNYCICYFGPSDEYVFQLKLLKPVFEREFPGIKIFIGCRDDKTNILDGCNDILKVSDLKMRRFEFCHLHEIRYNQKTHPIEDFLVESSIRNVAITNEVKKEHTNRCVIISQGSYPTVSLTSTQIDLLKRQVVSEGFEPVISNDIEGAGLVIGVESLGLFKAASLGIKTKLVPTGIGARLYKLMFPSGVVLHN